ncbi:VOC family protein [Actinopolymorpha rutila]|uniref:VOC domain-containing protein n=1 Tax=Actinopolymorpha rutila TaxID=446787 RepID=A0A852ZM36_9ACTN|nr:VOC family protein [Actinopolymorpha rutila]NYH92938.1 hypothetical protein [Actinopolymorpha rutila]
MISAAPIRFTANIDEMRRFLELLGFEAHIVSERKSPPNLTWVEMRGDVSIIGLHGADREESYVMFDTDEPLEALQARLQEAGFNDARITDEAWGRMLEVTDPQGESVQVNERMKDTYGYRVVD